MGITTKDLAKLCGVSRTTVHRALHETGRINPATKEMILRTAEENGYRPDLLARGLVKGKTNIIGAVVLDVKNQYFAQMLSVISAEATRRDYCVNIMLHDNSPFKEKEQISRLADYHVDGIIVSSVNKGSEYVDFLNSLDIPIVSVDNKIADGIPFVGIEQRMAMRTATEQAIQSGYTKLVLVCPPISDENRVNVYVHKERLAGFCEAIKDHKNVVAEYLLQPVYLDNIESYVDDYYKTVFMCSADEFALSIMKKLKESGKTAGKDYGIIGFDNISMLEYVSPRLSTISNSVDRVAAVAVNKLFSLIIKDDGEVDDALDSSSILLPYEFITGDTLNNE